MAERYYKKGNLLLEVYVDDDPINPRERGMPLGHLWCWHRKYDMLGDDDNGIRIEDYGGWTEVEEVLQTEYEAALVVPVYMFDHSGLAFSTRPFDCSWDSGQVGFLWITEKELIDTYGVVSEASQNLARKVMTDELEEYAAYVEGEVFDYTLYENGQSVRSCSGFYGYDDEKSGLLVDAFGTTEGVAPCEK